MEFNFLIPKLLPKVSCSAPTVDNYEADNLINEVERIRARGFLAYSSIKPPVDVDFKLLCPISISYILILTTVGTQKTTAIEILARNNNSEFISIAKAHLINEKESGIVACNSRLFSSGKLPENYREGLKLCFFKSNTFRTFTNATDVRIRILRTEKSVPCLGKVEIWGKVSRFCSEVTVRTVHQLMNGKTNNCTEKHETTRTSSDAHSSDTFEVPDEFKDALTFEIMALPMTLPSGSTVDRSTLDKYVENEASRGRHPSDPFTGLKFTEDRKPVLNVWLKSRIDMFLLQNANKTEIFSVKRTLGKVNDAGNSKKFKIGDESPCSSSALLLATEPDDCKKQNLEDVIQKAMSSSGFIKFTTTSSSEEENTTNADESVRNCVLCKDKDNLYSLPCEHLYCRKCLVTICKELKCSDCGLAFNKNEPTKFHCS